MKRWEYKFLLLAVMAALLMSMKSKHSAYTSVTPPGGVKINDTLYYDQTEMTNIGWQEYLFWTGKIFGKDSREYLDAMPVSGVWLEGDTCLFPLAEFYLSHPAYRHHPLVGVSQTQAIAYSQWRSDRVFEKMLINAGVIKEDTAQSRERYFTIATYFAGKYHALKPDTNYMYYPEYRLPTIDEWKMAVHYSDSLDRRYRKYHAAHMDYMPCAKTNKGGDPTESVFLFDYMSERHNPIYHLRGNVAEWTSVKDVNAGGGWKNDSEKMMRQDTLRTIGVNAWTGFRNVCVWRRWGQK